MQISNIFTHLYSQAEIGQTTVNIEANPLYYIGAAIFLVLFFVSLIFVWWTHKNRNYEPVYNLESKFAWLKKFWYKNRFTFSVFLSVILLLTSISFFLVASGSL